MMQSKLTIGEYSLLKPLLYYKQIFVHHIPGKRRLDAEHPARKEMPLNDGWLLLQDLHRRTGMDITNMPKTIKTLEEKGLLERDEKKKYLGSKDRVFELTGYRLLRSRDAFKRIFLACLAYDLVDGVRLLSNSDYYEDMRPVLAPLYERFFDTLTKPEHLTFMSEFDIFYFPQLFALFLRDEVKFAGLAAKLNSFFVKHNIKNPELRIKLLINSYMLFQFIDQAYSEPGAEYTEKCEKMAGFALDELQAYELAEATMKLMDKHKNKKEELKK